MVLLGIDTCGSEATLALARLEPEGTLTKVGSVELAERTTAAGLVPALGRMLEAGSLTAGSIEGIVVVDGPGSFTGIRIGVSTAKALAEALGRPLFAISRLRVLCEANGAGAALLDAGRGEVYFGAAGAGGHDAEECLLGVDEAAERVERSTAAGRPVVACEVKVMAAIPRVKLVAAPTAFDAVRAAVPDVLAGRRVDVAELDGRYVRRSDLYARSARA